MRIQEAIFKLSTSGSATEEVTWEYAAQWQVDKAERLPGVVDYLRPFGYEAATGDFWSGDSSPQDRPEIRLRVERHVENQGRTTALEQHFSHTWYVVECSIDLKRPQGQFQWQAPRRLAQLRVGLHDPLKACSSMGEGFYTEHFGQTPFAKHGGLPGTTERLHHWLLSLSNLLNSEQCAPYAVALALNFFKAHNVIKRRAPEMDSEAWDQPCPPEDGIAQMATTCAG